MHRRANPAVLAALVLGAPRGWAGRGRASRNNFFAKLKQFRGIATRYDKTARNLLAAIHLAAAHVWLI